MTDWDENSRRLRANLTGVAERLSRGAHVREAPTTDLALRWHEDMLANALLEARDAVAGLDAGERASLAGLGSLGSGTWRGSSAG